MFVADCVVRWTGTGAVGDPYRPDLTGLPVLGYADTTGQAVSVLVPNPDAFVAQLQVATAADVATLDADARVVVLTSWEEVPDGTP